MNSVKQNYSSPSYSYSPDTDTSPGNYSTLWVWWIVISVFLQACAILANAPIVLIILSTKSLLKNPSTRYFVLSLCLSHFLISTISLLEYSPIPYILLDGEIILFCSLWVWLSTLITLTLISLERYVTIAKPMQCKRIVTPQRCFISICLTWISTGILVIPLFWIIEKGYRGWFFGPLMFLATVGSLTFMTLCYSHIFTIAKEKWLNNKPRLGQFRRGSISSEWPTTVGGNPPPSPKPMEDFSRSMNFHKHPKRGSSSTSLLQRVLLRHYSDSSSSSTPNSSKTSSPSASVRSSTSSNTKGWRAYLKHNYNSPRKTVATILTLIGSVVITSIPPALTLIIFPSLFPPLHAITFPLSSICLPILYGILNRNIRHHLIKIFSGNEKRSRGMSKSLRRKKVRNKKGSGGGIILLLLRNKRKSSIPTEDDLIIIQKNDDNNKDKNGDENGQKLQEVLQDDADTLNIMSEEEQPSCSFALQTQRQDHRNSEVRVQIHDHEEGRRESGFNNGEEEDQREIIIREVNNNNESEDDEDFDDLDPNALNLPRKTSQDSGADMSYSSEEEDDDEDDCDLDREGGDVNSSRDNADKV